jgi:hypothetical protein
MDMLTHTIRCPLEWCTGTLADHGGLGDDPTHWVHSDGGGLPVAPRAALCRDQLGAEPSRWVLVVNGAEVSTGDSPASVAEGLRDLAHAVDAVASAR